MTIAIISHPDCLLHVVDDHPESPERVRVIDKGLKDSASLFAFENYKAPPASFEQLIQVHDEAYVQWIMSIAPKNAELISIDNDTFMNQYTYQAALHAAGSVVFAVDLVQQGKAHAAFCNVRPPGHHAEKKTAMGFCIFNNVAVGVMHAIKQYRLARVAIIDFDVHHGNGTQNIFQDNEQVLYCSSFQHPFYPGYDSEKDNNHILNIPLLPGTGGDAFRQKVKAAWFNQLAVFKPQLIFFSAGFDGHVNDPLANLNLNKEDYVWLTTEIAKIAKEQCAGKIVSVLEGGYNLEALYDCVPAHVRALVP